MLLNQSPAKLFYPAPAWLPIISLGLFSAFCIALGLGTPFRLGFPFACFLIGVFLFFRYPILYIGFSWWIWFLTPFVRRLIDFNAGWVDPNPVLLAPFFVSLVSIVTFVRSFPRAVTGAGLPFVLCLLAIAYGTIIGMMEIPSKTAIAIGILNWLTPVVFGYHLFANWRRFPEIRQVTQRVFLWAVLVMGVYGIIQFLMPMPWDRFWLQNVIETLKNYTLGRPEPLGIRVFSTMHSHQPFSCVMVAGLLLLLSMKHPFKLVTSGAGYLALLLTLARTAWLSWLIGIVVFLPSLKPKFQVRLIVTLMALLILVIPLTTIEPFSTVIGTRIQSFFSGTQDGSFIDRTLGYSNLLDEALTNVQGQGVGYVIQDPNIGSYDSGILVLLFNLGWLGGIPYVIGLLLLIVSILQGGQEGKFEPSVSACRAIALATFSQIGLNAVMLSNFGMILWGFIGLSVAARSYYAQPEREKVVNNATLNARLSRDRSVP